MPSLAVPLHPARRGSGKRECAKNAGGLRIWLEPLPDTLAGAVNLVEELSLRGQ